MANKIPVGERIKQLRAASKTGSQIASILRDEGYTLNETKNAMFGMGYAVHQCRRYRDHISFHVSDQPSTPAKTIAILFAKPRSLSLVTWYLE